MGTSAICSLEQVSKHYRVKKGFFSQATTRIKALNKVNLEIRRQEILGLVGESGCGKSTLARLVLGLERPSGGKILFEQTDLSSLSGKGLKDFRKRAQMVFQDPFSSLNPKKTIFQIISQPLRIHKICPRERLEQEVRRLLTLAGLSTPGLERRYPHEFSGGQRQRIGIARALATRPELVVMDEPTSALDVSIQAQIINLILDLQETERLTCLFISHDLPIVQFVSHRVAVMYKGTIVETMPKGAFGLTKATASNNEIHHPYTSFLMKSIPVPSANGIGDCNAFESSQTEEHAPGISSPESGCVFWGRCPYRMKICQEKEPVSVEVGKDHFISCHLFKAKEKERQQT